MDNISHCVVSLLLSSLRSSTELKIGQFRTKDNFRAKFKVKVILADKHLPAPLSSLRSSRRSKKCQLRTKERF